VAAFIAAQGDRHGIPLAAACRALGVSRSWFYKWAPGQLPPRAARREQLKAEVARLFRLHEGKYGSPRITADLQEAGWRVSENTVAALMREQGLAARRKKKRKATTRPGKGRWRAPDLVRRDFPAQKINQKWYGDHTEIPTDEGKLHLASVLDVGSRRVLGFALSEHHDARNAYGALAMAVAVRGGAVPGVIMHTDQGGEFTAGLFRAACERLSISQSMGRPGSALDNAVIEAWHSTVEFELRRAGHFATRAAARAGVAAWIEDYNLCRRHSSLGMLSPVAYEQALAAEQEAA
jgi:putative transposase